MRVTLRKQVTRKVTIRLSEADLKPILESFLGLPTDFSMYVSHSDFQEAGYVEFEREWTTYEDDTIDNLEEIPDEFRNKEE